MDAPPAPTTLTAHLARAKLEALGAARAVARHQAETTADGTAAAELGEDAEGERCAASVISGQRCRRLAVHGHTLCAGHIAMGTNAASALG